MAETVAVRECPFPECDWSKEYDPDNYAEEVDADWSAEMHYEKEHGGRVRIQVTLETEEILGGRDHKDIRERILDEEDFPGYSIAFVATEVVEEADDHSVINGGIVGSGGDS